MDVIRTDDTKLCLTYFNKVPSFHIGIFNHLHCVPILVGLQRGHQFR